MSFILTALQVILAGLLVWSAAAKLMQADEFVAALRLSHLPEAGVLVLATAIPAVEAVLGVWLLISSPAWLPVSFWLVAALFAGFTGWMGWVLARGLRVRCGCFGPGGGHVSGRTVGRNVVLLAMAVTGAMLARQSVSLVYDRSIWWVLTVIAGALVLVMLAALRYALPHLTLTDAQFRQTGGRE